MIDIQVLASGSSGNAYRIDDGRTPLLLDCGIPWKKIKEGLNFDLDISGILLTHSHQDHSKSIKDAIKAGIDCYMLRATADEIGVSGHRVHIIEPKQQFSLGSWEIMPFDTVHDCPSVGFLLVNQQGEKLAFITDTAYCKYKFSGLTHIMCECNFADDIIRANVDAGIITPELRNRIIQTHFSLANVKEFLRKNIKQCPDLQEIRLIHLSNDNSDAERFKREIQQLTGIPAQIA